MCNVKLKAKTHKERRIMRKRVKDKEAAQQPSLSLGSTTASQQAREMKIEMTARSSYQEARNEVSHLASGVMVALQSCPLTNATLITLPDPTWIPHFPGLRETGGTEAERDGPLRVCGMDMETNRTRDMDEVKVGNCRSLALGLIRYRGIGITSFSAKPRAPISPP